MVGNGLLYGWFVLMFDLFFGELVSFEFVNLVVVM